MIGDLKTFSWLSNLKKFQLCDQRNLWLNHLRIEVDHLSICRMKTGIVLEEEHTKIWNVQRRLGYWWANYQVSLIHLFGTRNIFFYITCKFLYSDIGLGFCLNWDLDFFVIIIDKTRIMILYSLDLHITALETHSHLLICLTIYLRYIFVHASLSWKYVSSVYESFPFASFTLWTTIFFFLTFCVCSCGFVCVL